MKTPQLLSGVRVLDLSRVLAGPLCSMMLADLGASVIKVERPETGDDTRGWGPPFDADGQSAYFLSVNRNKLSVAMNLADAEQVARLLALIDDADVVLENYLPGVLTRYGIDADSCMARNDRLIWCTISGFGPDSRRPGYDFVVQAESGWMAITGDPAGDPMKHGVAMVDVTAGKDATIGILAALAARERAGAAGLSAAQRQVHVSLQSSAEAVLVNVAQNALVSGGGAKRWGNAHANLVPYQLFHAADRPVVIAVGNDSQWLAAARALGLEELADDPALATNAGRLAQRERVVQAISDAVSGQKAAVTITQLERAGVPCGVVRQVRDVVDDAGGSPCTGMPPVLNGRVRYPSPKLNEHAQLIEKWQWSAFDHMPILSDDDV
jgi:crotonobetainyl-CoA:carnitine CoA-transferase CaiB-like acyl-CoA transferase